MKAYYSIYFQHIVVLRKGIYYKLDMFDVSGQPLAPCTIEKQIEWIIKDADEQQGEFVCFLVCSFACLTWHAG